MTGRVHGGVPLVRSSDGIRCRRRISRRRLLRVGGAGIAGATLLGVAGCGGTGEGGPSGGTRTVEHLLGETKVPENPRRVVCLDTTPADAALAVGVEPVGAPIIGSTEDSFPGQLESRMGGAEPVGTPEQPNLEAIAALDPDLILCGDWQEDLYDKLSEIAPTVADGSAMEDWKTDMRIAARALGREARMEGEISAYEGRAAKFKGAMGERLEEVTVSLVIFYADAFRIYMPESFMGMVVGEAGLRRPEHQLEAARRTEGGGWALDPSNERLPLVDADVIFAIEEPGEGRTYRDVLRGQGNPLYANLEAVKNGRVHPVSFDAWLAGRGIMAANVILDDLNRYLIGGRP